MDMEKIPPFQELLKLLNENDRVDQARDLSLLAWYLDGMEHQLDTVLQELQSVKSELAQVTEQHSPSRSFLAKMVETLETKVEQAREHLVTFQDKIVECTKEAVDRFKEAGVSALDNAVTAMGVKKGLEHLEEGLKKSLISIEGVIEKAEEMGMELRQAGQHIKNVGRIAADQGTNHSPKIEEGRIQSVILAPMRTAQTVLSDMRNSTLAAIGGVENLELSAEAVREARAERQAEKKPSIRQMLTEKKAEAAARAAPAPDKEHKAPEASL